VCNVYEGDARERGVDGARGGESHYLYISLVCTSIKDIDCSISLVVG
jgi:hypothetical protein